MLATTYVYSKLYISLHRQDNNFCWLKATYSESVYKLEFLSFICHSGLSGIFPMASKKDSRRASLAGMTYFWSFTILYKQTIISQKRPMGFSVLGLTCG